MPLRCPELLRKVYREVAAGHPAVVLVDGPKVLEAKSRHGLIGDQFFHDAQHPNLHGYVALAEDLVKQLGARRAFSWPADQPVPAVDPESCARHFKIGPEQWADRVARRVVLPGCRVYPLRPAVSQRASVGIPASGRRDQGRAMPRPTPVCRAGPWHRSQPRLT